MLWEGIETWALLTITLAGINFLFYFLVVIEIMRVRLCSKRVERPSGMTEGMRKPCMGAKLFIL